MRRLVRARRARSGSRVPRGTAAPAVRRHRHLPSRDQRRRADAGAARRRLARPRPRGLAGPASTCRRSSDRRARSRADPGARRSAAALSGAAGRSPARRGAARALGGGASRRHLRGDRRPARLVGDPGGASLRGPGAQRLPHEFPRLRAALPRRLARADRRALSPLVSQSTPTGRWSPPPTCRASCRPGGSGTSACSDAGWTAGCSPRSGAASPCVASGARRSPIRSSSTSAGLAPEKNIDLAIAAYRAMQRQHPSLRFVLVGDGPLRAHLAARLIPRSAFCGAHTGERLAAHYASGDVFLFPSETETFGERDARGVGQRTRGGGLRLRGGAHATSSTARSGTLHAVLRDARAFVRGRGRAAAITGEPGPNAAASARVGGSSRLGSCGGEVRDGAPDWTPMER